MKTKASIFVLAAALVAGAPAVAHAFQHGHEGASHAAPAPAHGGEHASAEEGAAVEQAGGEHAGHEEGHHALPPINWFDFSNKEQPPYGAMLINFVLLMAMYVGLGRKGVSEGLKARRASIAKEIEEAQRMRAEAEERATKYQEKLQHLEAELKDTREAMKAAGEAEKTRIVREAEEKAARMEKDAKFLVEQELKQMRIELTRDAIEMATSAAEELLKKRITPADQERLAEDYLAELGAKRPGTESMRPAAPSMGGGE